MVRRGPHPPDRTNRGQTPLGARRASAAVVAIALAALTAAACAGGGGGTSGFVDHPRSHRPAPFAGARQIVARYVRRRESRAGLAELRVHVATLGSHRRSETVLVTASARLGRRPGTAWVGLGQRALVLRRRGGRLRVVADVTRGGGYPVARDGVAAMPRRSRFRAGRQVVVVSAPDVPAADAAEVVRVADGELPGLIARYRLQGGHPRAPVIFITDSWDAAQRVSGVQMPHEAVGAEYRGLVYLALPQWSREDAVSRDALLVHELTHVASAALVAGCPLSLVEGVARYEEQRYAAAAGSRWPYGYLAAAYRRGYPSAQRWGWTFGHWMVRRPLPTWLAYEDGAAIVRAVVHDGGDAALRRLGAAFRRDGVSGRFTSAQVDAAFRRAVGRSFAQVVAEAHAETIAAAG
jgi:hypothetical protein